MKYATKPSCKIGTMAGSVEEARRVRRQRLLRFSEERFKKILQSDSRFNVIRDHSACHLFGFYVTLNLMK